MSDLLTRPYAPRDLCACVAIFDSNVPRYFAPEERTEFCGFLAAVDAGEDPFLVVEQAGRIVACGGLTVAGGRASLSWGMVERAFHGRGIGTALTRARLARAREMVGVQELVLSTSQHTRGFYEGFGFVICRITPDGFGPGLDRCDMRLALGG